MLPELNLFGISIPMYTTINTLATVAAILWLMGIGLNTFTTWKRFLQFAGCSVVAILLLQWGGQNLNALLEKGILSSVANIGGLVLYMPVFLFCAYSFDKNGSPLYQLELAMPPLTLLQSLVRFACLCAGCCHGKPFAFGMVFPAGTTAATLYGEGTPVFPTQLAESFMMFICLAIILALRKKGKHYIHVFPMMFGVTGFVLEFFMGGLRFGRRLFGTFTMLQLLYFIFFVLGVIFYFTTRKPNLYRPPIIGNLEPKQSLWQQFKDRRPGKNKKAAKAAEAPAQEKKKKGA